MLPSKPVIEVLKQRDRAGRNGQACFNRNLTFAKSCGDLPATLFTFGHRSHVNLLPADWNGAYLCRAGNDRASCAGRNEMTLRLPADCELCRGETSHPDKCTPPGALHGSMRSGDERTSATRCQPLSRGMPAATLRPR